MHNICTSNVRPVTVAAPCVILLAEFCERYEIDAEDCDQLTKLPNSTFNQVIAVSINLSTRTGMATLGFQSFLGMTSWYNINNLFMKSRQETLSDLSFGSSSLYCLWFVLIISLSETLFFHWPWLKFAALFACSWFLFLSGLVPSSCNIAHCLEASFCTCTILIMS